MIGVVKVVIMVVVDDFNDQPDFPVREKDK